MAARIDYKWHRAGFGTWQYRDYLTETGALRRINNTAPNSRVYVALEGEVIDNSPKSPYDAGEISWRATPAVKVSRWQRSTAQIQLNRLRGVEAMFEPGTIMRYRVFIEM